MLTSLFAQGRSHPARAALGFLLALAALWSTLANAAHTSIACPAKSGTVSKGGTVSINVTDCTPLGIGFAASGPVDGPALPAHGSANLRITGSNWFVDYSHNGDTATSDYFEFTDASGNGGGVETVGVTITITPSASPITVTPPSLPTMTAGTPFSQTLTSTGGVAPYTYTLQSGVLPVGLSLSSGGVLSGTPTQRGGYTFSVRSTDSRTPTAQFVDKGYTGTVQNPTLTLATPAGTAIQAAPFSQTLSTSGGVAPYTYALETGTLPAGITLSSAGVVSGTTTAAAGNYPVTIRVTDASTGAGSYFEVESYTLTVSPPPSVSIAVSPASVSEDGVTNLGFTVTRSLNLTSPTVVNITTSGTATAGTDYTGNVATVSIPAGGTTATITIDPTADTSVEPNETVTLTVAAGTGYTVGVPASATGTIANDDLAGPTLTLTKISQGGVGAFTFTGTNGWISQTLTTTTSGVGVSGATQTLSTAGVLTTLTEAAPPGYVLASANCSGMGPGGTATLSGNTLTLSAAATASGANIACTFTNVRLPTLTLTKISQGGVGAFTFTGTNGWISQTLTTTTSGVGVSGATQTLTAAGVAASITEALPPGYALVSANCTGMGPGGIATLSGNTLTLSAAATAAGANIACTFTNVRLPTLTLTKISQGGVGAFTFTGTNGWSAQALTTTTSGVGVSGATQTLSTAGVLTTLTEAAPPGYVLASANCSGMGPGGTATLSGNTLTLSAAATAAGANIACTFTNVRLPTLTLTKISQGGVGAFTFTGTNGWSAQTLTTTTSGVGVSGATQTLAADGVATTLTEAVPPGYTLVSATCTGMGGGGTATLSGNTLTLSAAATAAGANIACTFTNVRLPTLTLTKISQGGVGAFTFTGTNGWSAQTLTTTTPGVGVTGATQTLASSATLTSITESPVSGFLLASATCTGMGPGGTAFLSGDTLALDAAATAAGANIVCTFTNNQNLTDAVNDFYGPYNGAIGGTTPSVLTNDTLGGSPATVGAGGNVALTPGPGPTPPVGSIAMNPDGTITVAPGTMAGSYAYPYGLCAVADPANCDTATATIAVSAAPIDAVDDAGTVANGAVGGVAVPNVLVNDRLNGGPATLSGVMLRQTGTTDPNVTLNPATGEVRAAPGTPAGTYTVVYEICEVLNPTNCDSASVVVTVTDAPPIASNSALTVAYGAPATNVSLSLSGGAPTSLAITTPPIHGSAVVSGLSVTYQPTSGYAGPDSFTYTASNGGGTSAAATVSITVQDPVITITSSGGFSATVASPYTQTFTFNGGAPPWSGFQVTNLPAGLSITGTTANTVTISGTPTQAGTFNLGVSATDSSTGNGPYAVGQGFTLTVAAPTLNMTPAPGTLTAAYATPYSQVFTASGGVGPYSYAVTGALPSGLSLSGDTISGTPTAPGNYPITITATDTGATGSGSPFTIARNYTIDVAAPTIIVNPATLPDPVATTAYSQTITATGGATPYTFSVTAGALPAGITLASGGTLSGTSNAVGTHNFTVTATDAHGQTGNRAYSVTIAAPTLTLTPAAGTLTAPYGAAYSQAFTATGGSGSFSYALTGALPAGLTFSAGTLSGTPTAPGSYPITVTATDSVLTGTGAPFHVTQSYTLVVPAPTIALAPTSIPAAAIGTAYSQALTASGGVAPYSFAVTGGSAPAGITLTTGGSLGGLPTAVGSFAFTVTATDAHGQTGSQAYTLTVAAPTLTLTPASGTAFTGTYNTPFLQAFTAGGGVGPYTYAVSAGSLPSDLSLDPATGVLSGTPLAAWNVTFSITATDTGTTGTGAPFTVTQNYSFVSAAPTVTVTPATIPNAVPSVAYSQQLSASGGVGPYAFQLRTGSLPTGITLNGTGLIAGTTTEVGTYTFSIRAIDAHGFDALPYPTYTLVVDAPTLTLTPAAGTLTAPYGVAYSQAFTAAGGSGSYTFAVSGSLPNGLSLSGGTLSGTPTAPGSYPITVTATDSVLTGSGAPFRVTQTYTLDVSASITLTPASLPAATAGVAYTQALSASGGASPYTFSVTAGSLPSGLALASDGTLSGTPTASGNFSVTVQATDANTVIGSRSYTLVVGNATLDLTPATLPDGSAGVAYAQPLGASGGVAPYRFAVTAGSLPLGLSLSSDGSLGGTPTVAGTFAFTVTATDSTTGTASSGSRAYSLTVAAPTIAVDATLPAATVGQAYTAAATASGGVAPYTFALAAGSLPPGLAIDAGGHVTGTPTTPGSYPVTLAATDANGFRGTVAVVLTVQAAPVVEATPVPLDARWALLLVGLSLAALGVSRLRAASRGSRP